MGEHLDRILLCATTARACFHYQSRTSGCSPRFPSHREMLGRGVRGGPTHASTMRCALRAEFRRCGLDPRRRWPVARTGLLGRSGAARATLARRSRHARPPLAPRANIAQTPLALTRRTGATSSCNRACRSRVSLAHRSCDNCSGAARATLGRCGVRAHDHGGAARLRKGKSWDASPSEVEDWPMLSVGNCASWQRRLGATSRWGRASGNRLRRIARWQGGSQCPTRTPDLRDLRITGLHSITKITNISMNAPLVSCSRW